MGELRTFVNKNFLELGKQVSELCLKVSELALGGVPPKPLDLNNRVSSGSYLIKQPHTYYQLVVNLDKPCNVVSVMEDPNYSPAKHIKVSMPRFDET